MARSDNFVKEVKQLISFAKITGVKIEEFDDDPDAVAEISIGLRGKQDFKLGLDDDNIEIACYESSETDSGYIYSVRKYGILIPFEEYDKSKKLEHTNKESRYNLAIGYSNVEYDNLLEAVMKVVELLAQIRVIKNVMHSYPFYMFEATSSF